MAPNPNSPNMLEDLLACIGQAGEIALSHFRTDGLRVFNKLNDSDIVTEADREVEAFIRGFMANHYPSHSMLGEETGESPASAEDDTKTEGAWRWVVDPIDGTTNFYAGIPFWAVSIGIQGDGETQLAAVFNPATGELFHAVKGEGAFLNGKRIGVLGESRLSRCVVATGFPVDRASNPANNLAAFTRVLPRVRDVRRLGAASVDMAYTAAGFLSGYWELNLHEWDVCAGELIATEAGAVCDRFRPDRNVSMLCASPAIYQELKALVIGRG